MFNKKDTPNLAFIQDRIDSLTGGFLEFARTGLGLGIFMIPTMLGIWGILWLIKFFGG